MALSEQDAVLLQKLVSQFLQAAIQPESSLNQKQQECMHILCEQLLHDSLQDDCIKSKVIEQLDLIEDFLDACQLQRHG